MGSALSMQHKRATRHLHLAPRKSAAAALAATAFAACALLASPRAQAASNAACLLMGRVIQVQNQPLQEHMVQLHIQGVRSNNTLPNEIECPKVFKTGSTLWLSLNGAALNKSAAPRNGERLWFSLRYMENNGIVLRKYEAISRKTYLEKKDGIQ